MKKVKAVLSGTVAAAAATLVSTTASADTYDYTVVQGDTLWHLAAVTNDTVENIAARNAIDNPNLIYIDQVVTLDSTADC